ncbi:MAG: hypothetical protein JWO01_887 [Microbacteriaceae bacterium]|nr:hypothetical protein [Microbacteriaceae bacterium]
MSVEQQAPNFRMVVDSWLERLAAELSLDPGFRLDDQLILDLAYDAGNEVARPAAPLTTFLVGLAAGQAGGSAEDVTRAIRLAVKALEQRRD